MKQKANKHTAYFKVDLTRKNNKETGELCRCGTPAVWCDGTDCPPETVEMNVEEAAEQAEFAAALEAAREFGV